MCQENPSNTQLCVSGYTSNVTEMDSLKSGHDIYIKAHVPHISDQKSNKSDAERERRAILTRNHFYRLKRSGNVLVLIFSSTLMKQKQKQKQKRQRFRLMPNSPFVKCFHFDIEPQSNSQTKDTYNEMDRVKYILCSTLANRVECGEAQRLSRELE